MVDFPVCHVSFQEVYQIWLGHFDLYHGIYIKPSEPKVKVSSLQSDFSTRKEALEHQQLFKKLGRIMVRMHMNKSQIKTSKTQCVWQKVSVSYTNSSPRLFHSHNPQCWIGLESTLLLMNKKNELFRVAFSSPLQGRPAKVSAGMGEFNFNRRFGWAILRSPSPS